MRWFGDQLQAALVVESFVFGNGLEGKTLQGIPSQNRCCFSKADVTGGAAATQVVVVHRRQVVMYQRVGMNHLQRAGGCQQLRASRSERLPRGQQQQRSKALTAGEDTPADRAVNGNWLVRLGWKQLFQLRVDSARPRLKKSARGTSSDSSLRKRRHLLCSPRSGEPSRSCSPANSLTVGRPWLSRKEPQCGAQLDPIVPDIRARGGCLARRVPDFFRAPDRLPQAGGRSARAIQVMIQALGFVSLFVISLGVFHSRCYASFCQAHAQLIARRN